MLAAPGATPVTWLTEPTVATAGLSEAQIASRVMFCVAGVAERSRRPEGQLGSGRNRAAHRRDGDGHEGGVRHGERDEALADPSVAVIADVPGARALPAAAAADFCYSGVGRGPGGLRGEVARAPVLKVPIAENCWLVVAAMVVSPGWIASEARSAALTVAVAVPLTEPDAAVMVVAPSYGRSPSR